MDRWSGAAAGHRGGRLHRLDHRALGAGSGSAVARRRGGSSTPGARVGRLRGADQRDGDARAAGGGESGGAGGWLHGPSPGTDDVLPADGGARGGVPLDGSGGVIELNKNILDTIQEKQKITLRKRIKQLSPKPKKIKRSKTRR